MLPVLEKLLILQERDRQIQKAQTELDGIEPQRQAIQGKLGNSQAHLETVRTRARQLESDRKKLELDVEAKKQLIDKYSVQQFQTKKNEEYRALAHEIEVCKEAIIKLDDQQIELMEQIEAVQKDVNSATTASQEFKKQVESQVTDLTKKEGNLKTHLDELKSGRDQLTTDLDESTLSRYERLRKNKGGTVLAGIQHSVCGGCHMKLPTQIVVACQGGQDIITCSNCGRILYYTRDMDLQFVD